MRSGIMRLLVFGFVALMCTAGQAQDRASVTGVVTDSTGAVVPKVEVTLDKAITNTHYRTHTNTVGSYTFANVAPGPGYQLTFSLAGFKPVVMSGIYLNVSATRTQNAQLTVGSSSQTVEVSASSQAVTLNTTDATVGNNFQVQFMQDLPVQYRDNPSALFYQQPGVSLQGAVTGARVDQTNVTVDGLEANDNATGQFGTIVGMAPVDSVQEFRGVVAGSNSSSGQGGGGQFDLVTKSGTNQFHGDVNWYHRDTDTEANDWFNNNAGVSRPPLVRNQFGGQIGGPILKNKAYFFFDYDGRRDARSILVDRTVPLGTDSSGYRGGEVSYINSSGSISTLTPSQVANLDPQQIGWNQAELTLFQNRYPQANDLTGDVGDLVNTAGYRFNAPDPYSEDIYVERLDFTLNDSMKLFVKSSLARRGTILSAQQFPGDPTYTYPFYDRSYDWVVGHTWTIGANKVNQAEIGETYEDFNFSVAYNPQGDNQFSYAGLSGPYGAGNNSQARTYPVPMVRDDFTWQKGRHSLSFGGTFKWESPNNFAAENYNFESVGVTGNTNFTALSDQQRPSDISSSQYATSIYDSQFSTALGAIAQTSTNFNYDNKGAVLPTGTGLTLHYRYYETELYFGDSWKVTPSLTLTYGLRYQNYTVPYETHGNEAVAQLNSNGATSEFDFSKYWGDRIKQSAAGIATDSAVPFLQYVYGGKANNGPGYYHKQNDLFAPRVAFAFNPPFDRHTVVSGGAGIVYDHTIVNALQFLQLQTSGLFEATAVNNYGKAGNPSGSLSSSDPSIGGLPRFTALDTPPAPPAAPTVTAPYTPYVYNGIPYGLPYGAYNILINPQLKNPYNIEYNFGIQHEFPQGYILKMTYVGRLGRRLLAEADASQLIDFPDNTSRSDQTMAQAFGAMVTQQRTLTQYSPYGQASRLSAQPWFEDMTPGVANFLNTLYGGSYFANNTQAVDYLAYPYSARGDFSDAMYVLSAYGALQPNVGMASQYASNTVWTNKGFSDYNGLLVTLHKNAGYGLQFDLNYTWSHSIDNVSAPANFVAAAEGFGYICDVARPRECRGNSDFDATNMISGNFIYELPFGRGRAIGTTAPYWLNEAIGGWRLSGLPTWHTGYAYTVYSNAYVAGFINNAPATLTGPAAILQTHVQHAGHGKAPNAFANPTAALAAFTGPTGFNIGRRNNFRGPGYFNMDLGLGKTFPIQEGRVNLKFRCDAFNAFNHPNFSIPTMTGGGDITEANGIPFGTISSTVVQPGADQSSRVLQGSLRLEF